jgi:glycosyltransferase involved in cell wall biosynthesis
MSELKRAGNDVAAICRPKSRVEAFLRQHGIRYTSLPSYRPFSLASVKFLRMLLHQQGIQVVHVHFHSDIWPASLALRGDTGRKLFLSVYMGVPKKNDPLHRFIYNRVDALFTSSHELNARLPKLYGIPRSKVHLLPYGRRLEQYKRNEHMRSTIRARYGVAMNDFLVGTMVRIDPGKGVMDFARSFLYIQDQVRSDVKFMIVGEPTRKGRTKPGESPYEPKCEDYLHQIEQFITENKFTGRIILTGFQDDLIGFLSAFDIFVFPSRDELYSLVMLDAMCMGLPIIAARAGGNLHQITDGTNGLLYEVGNSEDVAKKMMIYLQHQDIQRQHAEAATQFVSQHHDMDRTIERLLEFYRP